MWDSAFEYLFGATIRAVFETYLFHATERFVSWNFFLCRHGSLTIFAVWTLKHKAYFAGSSRKFLKFTVWWLMSFTTLPRCGVCLQYGLVWSYNWHIFHWKGWRDFWAFRRRLWSLVTCSYLKYVIAKRIWFKTRWKE